MLLKFELAGRSRDVPMYRELYFYIRSCRKLAMCGIGDRRVAPNENNY